METKHVPAEPSKEWMDQFGIGVGGPSITCRCGRTHVAIMSCDLTEEERSEYIARHEAKPKSYVLEEGVDSVTATLIDGGEIVNGCECGMMARYERFVSTERKAILAYFRAVAEKAEKQANELKAGMVNLGAGVPGL